MPNLHNWSKLAKVQSTFWLKIKQFWPFEEISILSHGNHLGWGEPPKDDSGQVWFKLTQWFQRRRFLKKITDE
jgi:hypothetical protein